MLGSFAIYVLLLSREAQGNLRESETPETSFTPFLTLNIQNPFGHVCQRSAIMLMYPP